MHSFAALFSLAVALPLAAALQHDHHIHKRALATEYVHVTNFVYENAHVWVDLNGQPYSTSFEILTTQLQTELSAAPSSAPQPTTQAVVSASSIESAPANNLAAQPSSTSIETSAAPVVFSTPAVPTTTTSVVPVTTSEAVPTTTSIETSAAPAATSSSSGSSGSGEFSGDATFYDTGLGSCGWESTDSDLIAALNAPQFHAFGSMSNGNPACGKSATITRGGKSVTVKIVDLCPSCAYGSLDLSPAAFDQIADESEGRVEITWSWS